jgi:hypothetical protein
MNEKVSINSCVTYYTSEDRDILTELQILYVTFLVLVCNDNVSIKIIYVNDGTINEYGAADGMKTDQGNGHTHRKLYQ